jgi:hypothetical protein
VNPIEPSLTTAPLWFHSPFPGTTKKHTGIREVPGREDSEQRDFLEERTDECEFLSRRGLPRTNLFAVIVIDWGRMIQDLASPGRISCPMK